MSATPLKSTNSGEQSALQRWSRYLYQHQFVRFLLVGGTATALQYLFLVLLVELTGTPKVACSAIAFALSAVYNYLANYYFTFQATHKHRESSLKFAVVVVLGLALNTLVFYIADIVLPHYLLAQIIATGVTLISNFLLHKFWIYRS